MAGEMLGFYPSQKYIQNNWAPEDVMPGDLVALAQAQRKATDSGVLSTNLARSFLANALVENTPSYGVVNSKLGYPPSPQRDRMFLKLGLKVNRMPEGYELPTGSGPTQRALMAAAVLAEKARLYGEDKAIERYNGKGRAIEDVPYFGEQRADANNHARKVAEAEAMLRHPKNASVLGAFMDAYSNAGAR